MRRVSERKRLSRITRTYSCR